MNTILARFNIIDGKEAEAEEAMQKQAASVESTEPGALTYIFHRNRKDPSEITVYEIYADDATMRRKMRDILKKHMQVDEELDEEVRKRIKNLEEGTQAWELEYQKAMEQIKRKHGLE